MKIQTEVLEEWLSALLPDAHKSCLLDIGAYRGDFSKFALDSGLAKAGHLFEPNPLNHPPLESLCACRPQLTLHKIALGSESGPCDFHCSGDAATGSVLPYLASSASPISTVRVPCQTLDMWWDEHGQPGIGWIKIDTQGHDLDVLKGGGRLLAKSRPWIVTELIFAPLYVGQSQPSDLLGWAGAAGYDLAGLFNEHWSERGIIAFADAVLIPRESTPPHSDVFTTRPDSQSLNREIAELRRVCEERLALINYLHEEAAKRLRIIEELNRQLHPPAGN